MEWSESPDSVPSVVNVGNSVTRFKLHLAMTTDQDAAGPSPASDLSSILNLTRVVNDFLREIGEFIMEHLRGKYGKHLSKDVVQCFNLLPGTICKHVNLRAGDKFLVADIGGGTTDIVVQAKVDNSNYSMKVREVSRSSELSLPGKLASAWQEHDRQQKQRNSEDRSKNSSCGPDASDELELSCADMKTIFDSVVERIIELIRAQMAQTSDIKLMMVVGGFSASPYLMKRVRDTFIHQVEEVISPPDPGSAVCQGAVALAINKESIVSRIARKTYSIKFMQRFRAGLDPLEHIVWVEGIAKWFKKGIAVVPCCMVNQFVIGFRAFSYGIIARDIAIAGDRGLFPGTVERCLNKKWWLLAFARYRQH
ncbi:unnamed protein product [Sphagnum troendelagicum]|uniref:Actin-related protein 8 n=1 Tax=Sphagnum troendelagicum TaxID=128251 RepID=A0ABP0TGQ7_9BRYO